ncbi:hypothetical protein AAMO2058_001099400 [Amorphochlora amoebiformis]
MATHAGSPVPYYFHRCRFVPWKPSGVVCLAWTADGTCLGVGRENGDIEVWRDWACEVKIPGSGQPTISRLVWLPNIDGTGLPRLFSSGLTGRIIEWDLVRLCPKYGVSSHGGAIWSMEADETGSTIAVGCEDGTLRIFAASLGETIRYSRGMATQKGRILSLCWGTHKDDKKRKIIATGSDRGRISVWDAENGDIILNMRADKFGKEATWVQALRFVYDGSFLAVGDSIGKVTLWDMTFGTQIAVFSDHNADVTGLVAESNSKILYSASADGTVAQYMMIGSSSSHTHENVNTSPYWVKTHTRKWHSHDIRALAISKPTLEAAHGKQSEKRRGYGEWLVTGGVDTCLSVVSADRFSQHPKKILPVPHRTQCSIGNRKDSPYPLLMSFQGKTITIWRLGSRGESEIFSGDLANSSAFQRTESSKNTKLFRKRKRRNSKKTPMPGARMELSAPYGKLIEFETSADSLCEAKISPDGRFIGYSTTDRGQILRLIPRKAEYSNPEEDSKTNPELYTLQKLDFTRSKSEKIRNKNVGKNAGLPAFSRVVFLPNKSKGATWDGKVGLPSHPGKSHYAVTSGFNGLLEIWDLEKESKIGQVKSTLGVGGIRLLTASADGKHLATVDMQNRIEIFSTEDHRYPISLGCLPDMVSKSRIVTALSFHPKSRSIAVAFSDNKFLIFKLKNKQLSDWSQDYTSMLPQSLLSHPSKISQIVFDPKRPSTMLLVTNTCFFHVDLHKPVEALDETSASTSKRQRKYSSDTKEIESKKKTNFRMVRIYQPLQFLEIAGDHTFVVVETPWLDVLNSLPPPVYRHKYGT